MAVPDLENLTLCELSALVHSRALSPSELCEATLARIGAWEGAVHAFSHLDEEGARKTAAALGEEAARGEFRGLLHGIPLAVKDEFHVAGMPTGMRDAPDPRGEPEDATCVARLRENGAVIIGKTYMPVNGRLPPTRNPYNLAHTPGGTSSGSGAAVGARLVSGALGEQTMGSNLRPAAFCGVAGLKPTYGRISRFGCFPFAWSVDTVGIMALSMADVAVVLSVVAGRDRRDPSSLDLPPPPADLALASFAPPRIGVVANFYPERTGALVAAAISSATSRFAAAGARIEEVRLPEQFGLIWAAQRVLTASEGATFYAREHERRELSGSSGRAGALVPATYYLEARRVRSWVRGLVSESFAGFDALLMATTSGPAPEGTATGDASLLVPWSSLGFPAVNLPCGRSPEGLPLGLQLVSLPGEDHGLLRVGAWCESILGRLPAPVLATA